MFCPKCSAILLPKTEKGKKILECSCGYKKKKVDSFGIKEVMKEETQDKLVMTSFKCDSCDVVYNTTEHITRLRAFHREFYPNHLIVEDITK